MTHAGVGMLVANGTHKSFPLYCLHNRSDLPYVGDRCFFEGHGFAFAHEHRYQVETS